MTNKIIQGDSIEVLKTLKEDSVDAVVTDPPYGLSFMGKKWDYDVPSVELWREVFRVLKPGGHLLSFAGTRTQHRMAVNIEDAGFEIRDMIAWVYGSGFPKSHNIGKAVDKLQGNEREVVGTRQVPDQRGGGISSERTAETGGVKTRETQDTKGNSPWEGWGTALKPALEPITVARKPFKGTVAQNVLEHGTGGLNIDGSRVGTEVITVKGGGAKWDENGKKTFNPIHEINAERTGRFPANLIHDGSEEVVSLFPSNVKGEIGRSGRKAGGNYEASSYKVGVVTETGFKDSGSAARFFYCPKASKKDRNEGLEDKNSHPTVKPTALMQYLVRLVTPPGGVVLDPFTGSGSTGKACVREGFAFIGIEREAEYVEIAKARLQS